MTAEERWICGPTADASAGVGRRGAVAAQRAAVGVPGRVRPCRRAAGPLPGCCRWPTRDAGRLISASARPCCCSS